MADHVWMRHAGHGGVAALPDAAREAWEALGWTECEPPVDPDPAMVEHVPLVILVGEHGSEVAVEASSDDEESPTSTESEEE